MKLNNRAITSLMRKKGYKLTEQRRAVLHVLDFAHEYFNPQDIYKSVKQQHPEIGLVTVYRILNILVELGLVCEVYTGEKRRSYVLGRSHEHHHHLVCSQCGAVIDFNGCDLKQLEEKLCRETGFDIRGHLLEFSGRCQACQALREKSRV